MQKGAVNKAHEKKKNKNFTKSDGAAFCLLLILPFLAPKRIPQTGQLWWPVMVLGIAGALFVLAGVAAKVRK